MTALKNYIFPLKAAVFLSICALIFIPFMAYHHSKIMNGGGITFNDPVLEFFPSYDVSLFIFMITYGCVVMFTVLHLKDPEKLGKLMISYGILLMLRMGSMTLLPLNEPKGLVPLNDPFLNELIYPGEITTDLFFSGHIGIVFLIAFVSGYRLLFILIGLLLAFLLLLQHIHFSIDIIMAILVAYIISLLVNKLSFIKA